MGYNYDKYSGYCKKDKEDREDKEDNKYSYYCKKDKEDREDKEEDKYSRYCKKDKEDREDKEEDKYNCYCKKDKEDKEDNKCRIKNHNHEFLSSTDYEEDDECVEHNHRIAGVTGPPIKYDKSHVHKVYVLTDTFDDHFHEICDTTGPALYLPGGKKHIHLLKGTTSVADENNHDHDYYFTTLIEDPSNVPEDRKC